VLNKNHRLLDGFSLILFSFFVFGFATAVTVVIALTVIFTKISVAGAGAVVTQFFATSGTLLLFHFSPLYFNFFLNL